ncbi:MAG TPA: hypothetical protein VGC13_30330 [Longimicrobium sp.]
MQKAAGRRDFSRRPAELLDSLAAIPATELDRTVGDERDRPLGAGVSMR